MGLNSVMDTSLSAMFAAQAGLSTTSHNIANADVDGYSRQLNVTASRHPLSMPYGSIGQGVDVMTVRRAHDQFLLNNLRTQVATGEQYGSMDSALYEIEQILGSVDNDHLSSAINTFFESWSTLSTQPADIDSIKSLVVSNAESLITDMHSISNSLDQMEDMINEQVEGEIDTLNALLEQVGQLNSQIMAAEVGGHMANDLRDQRDNLITQISAITAVTTEERDDGSMDLILNGRTMITRDSVQQFTTRMVEEPDGGYRIQVLTAGTYHDVDLPDGRLKGLLESRDEVVTDVRDQLDSVASNLITAVNELHVQGRTGSSNGLLFFSGNSLHTIALNPAIETDHTLVATSRSGESGDSDIAQAIAALADHEVPGSNLTIQDMYRRVVTDVASRRSSYEFLVNNQEASIQAVEAKIASVSGVSVDEEAANMVRYQNTYNAAAKIITTVQAMFDSLINMV